MRQLFDWIEDDRNINPDHHNNNNNKFTTEEMVDPENQFEFTLYILNQSAYKRHRWYSLGLLGQ